MYLCLHDHMFIWINRNICLCQTRFHSYIINIIMLYTCEKECPISNVLVELNCCIKWNKLVKHGLSQESDGVSAHGHQKAGVGEHHATGGATGHCHTITSDTPQTCMLTLHRVVCKRR